MDRMDSGESYLYTRVVGPYTAVPGSRERAITIGISNTTTQNVDLARLQLNLLTRSDA